MNVALNIIFVNTSQGWFSPPRLVTRCNLTVLQILTFRSQFATIRVALMFLYDYTAKNQGSRRHTMKKIKLLLAGSSTIFCEGLTKLLESQSNIEVVWTSNSVSEVVKAATKYKPDVVLTDIQSSQSTSVKTIQRVRQVLPNVPIIVFTHSNASTDFFSAISAGATGYILKDTSFETFLKMIALGAEGNLVVTPPIAQTVIEVLKFVDSRKCHARVEGISLLSEQEKAVLSIMARGDTNKQIASILFITENTVKVHVRNIIHKLSAHDRVEASACAIEQGLLPGVRQPNAN